MSDRWRPRAPVEALRPPPARAARLIDQAGIVQLFSSRRRRDHLEALVRGRHRRRQREQVPLVLDLGRRLEADRVHLLHQLVIPVAVIAFARLQDVELGALLEMLGDLRRIGRLDLVHRLRDVLRRHVVAPRLVLRRLAVLLRERVGELLRRRRLHLRVPHQRPDAGHVALARTPRDRGVEAESRDRIRQAVLHVLLHEVGDLRAGEIGDRRCRASRCGS